MKSVWLIHVAGQSQGSPTQQMQFTLPESATWADAAAFALRVANESKLDVVAGPMPNGKTLVLPEVFANA